MELVATPFQSHKKKTHTDKNDLQTAYKHSNNGNNIQQPKY